MRMRGSSSYGERACRPADGYTIPTAPAPGFPQAPDADSIERLPCFGSVVPGGRPFSLCPSKHRQLGREGALVSGSRFSARHVGGELRISLQDPRWPQSKQYRHHHEVARAERTVDPFAVSEACGKLVQPVAEAFLHKGQPCLIPGGIALQDLRRAEVQDR